MRFDFSFLMFERRSFTSCFERVVGRWISFFGRLIDRVGSVLRMLVWAYFIAARKRVIVAAAEFVRFSAR